MNKFRRAAALAIVAIVAVVTSLIGCFAEAPTSPRPQDIVENVLLNLSSPTLVVGQTVHLGAIAQNGAGKQIDVVLTWSSSNVGVATISDSGIVTAITAGTTDISVTAGGEKASATLTVVPANPTQLSIIQQPSPTAQIGVAFQAQPSVQLMDATSHPVAQAGVAVVATIDSGGGTPGGSVTATTNAAGTATFSNLSVAGVIGVKSLKFTAGALPSVVSAKILFTAGPVAQLVITTQPSASAQSGVAFAQQPVFQLRDASNNPVQTATPVTASVFTGGGTLGGTTTVTASADNGVAAFSDLLISGVGAHTIRFTAGAVVVHASPITVEPSTPTGLVIGAQPSPVAQVGVPFAQQPVVRLIDVNNNTVAQSGVVVTALVASGSGTLTGTLTATTDASGAATFSNLMIVGGLGARTLSFTADGLSGVSSDAISVGTGPASKLTIVTQPSSAVQSGAAWSQQPSVRLEDVAGNLVSQAGVVVVAAIESGAGAIGGTLTATTNASGVATFTNLAITGVTGSRTVSFSGTGLATVTSGAISVSAGAASKLTMTTQPSTTAITAVAFTQQPAVQLRDASDNAVSQSGVVVTVSVASGSGSLSGTTTATTNASGVATFVGVSIAGGGPHTLSFTATGLTAATSSAVSVAANPPATQLVMSTQPSSSATSGVDFVQQPVVQLRDASGNVVNQSGVLVTVALASGSGTLDGTVTALTNGSGTATFTDLAITGSGSHTLTFTSVGSGVTAATSNAISVIDPPTQLGVSTQPSASATSAVAFPQQPVVQLRGATGAAVSQSGVVVTVALASGSGTLGGTLTATTNSGGSATFAGLVITGTGAHTLRFTATGLTAAISNTITVAVVPTQLGVNTQPSASATSAIAFAQQPVVQLRDVSGSAVSQAGVVVTAAVASGAGTLGGTLTATTNASGAATFVGLSITGSGAHTLTFTATGLTAATSNTIDVSAAAPTSQLTMTTEPSATATSGVAFAQQPAVQLRDDLGAAVSQAGVVVTASVASGSGAVGGTLTATTNGSGVATFTNLSITGSGAHTLTFTGTGLTAATSSTITVTIPATQLAVTTQPSTSATSAVAFPQQPVVQLRNASGGAVSQAGVVITAALASGSGSLSGTLTATTAAGGAATFTGLTITGSGAHTITFTSTGLTAATSGTITVTIPATQLAVTTQASATATSGIAFAQQPRAQLRDASGSAVSQSGVVITVALASGPGTLGGTLTATTNTSGAATFTGLSITGSGAHTLTFTATGLTAATSNTITVTIPATQLGVTTQPSASAASGVAFPQQPVAQLRDGSGSAVSQSGVVVTAAVASGSGALSGTLTATTNASGAATFTNLVITGTGAHTLTFTSTGLTAATSNTITVAIVATQLAVTTQPSTTAASGAAFAQQPRVQLRNASGTNVSQSGVVVTAAVASGSGTLGGTLTATTNGSGLATFVGLSITGSGAHTLTFTATGLTSATSGTITVSAPATQLAVTTQPSTSVVSAIAFPQQPVVQLRNAAGGSVSQSGVVVTAALASGSGTLSGTLTATTNGSGTATFAGLTITGSGAHTLTFTATGLTAATSGTITASAPATQLSITTQPTAAVSSDVAFPQQPVIQLRNSSGVAVSQSGVVVTAALASGTGTLAGTLTATTNATGVATFSSLAISGIGDFTVRFTATGLTGVTSATVTASAAAFQAPDMASNDFEGNTFAPAAQNGQWLNETPGNFIVDDPTGGGRGKIFRNTFGPATDAGGVDNRADINHFVSYYPANQPSHGSSTFFRGYLYFPPGTVNFTNSGTLRKLIYWRTGDGGSNQCDLVIGMFGAQMFVSIVVPGMVEYMDWQSTFLTTGQWQLIELEVNMNSAPGVANGSIKMYINGTQVYSRSNIPWTRPDDAVTRGWKWFGIGHQREGTGGDGLIEEERYWDKIAFSTKRIGP